MYKIFSNGLNRSERNSRFISDYTCDCIECAERSYRHEPTPHFLSIEMRYINDWIDTLRHLRSLEFYLQLRKIKEKHDFYKDGLLQAKEELKEKLKNLSVSIYIYYYILEKVSIFFPPINYFTFFFFFKYNY